MHPFGGGHARAILGALTPASATNGLLGVGVVGGVSAWVEGTGKILGAVVVIVSAVGYLYRTLIRPVVSDVREIKKGIEVRLPAVEAEVQTMNTKLDRLADGVAEVKEQWRDPNGRARGVDDVP